MRQECQFTDQLESQLNRNSELLLRRVPSDIPSPRFNDIWRIHGFNILLIVLRFIQKITKETFTAKFKLLTRPFFKIIKDPSSDYNYYKYKGYFINDRPSEYFLMLDSKFHFLQYYRRNYLKRIMQFFLLEPDDFIVILWNIYLLLIVTLNVLYVALRLSFKEIKDLEWSVKDFVFEQLPSYSFLLEIILKFNTCIYSKGVLIKNRRRLVRRYLKGEFTIDMLLIVPFFIGRQFDFIYLDLVIILKVFQISKLTNSLFNRLELTPKQTTIFDLFKLISFILLCAHFSACIWHKLGVWGDWGNYNSNTWLKQDNFYYLSWLDRYIISFYWSIVTMTTIGYGDITPVNLTERLYCIIMTLLSSAIFAYSINSIGQIFQDISKQSSSLKTNINALNKFLKNQNVSPSLQIKFRRYFEYFWSRPSQEVIQFADQIPKQLKDEFTVDIYMKLLKTIPLFKQFSQTTLNSLCLNFKEVLLQQDECLFNTNQQVQNLYVLVNGQIDLFVNINNKKRIIQKYKNPSLIGQLYFFLNSPYSTTAIATKNTKVLSMDKQKLIGILQQNIQDYELFKNNEEDVLFKKQYNLISIECEACQRKDHFITNCPLLKGGPNQTKVLLNYRHYAINERKQMQRPNHDRRISTKKHYFIVMESIIQYIMKNEEFCNLEGIKEQLSAAIKQKQMYEELQAIQKESVEFQQQQDYIQQQQQETYQSYKKQQQQNNFVQRSSSLMTNILLQQIPLEKINEASSILKSQDARLIKSLTEKNIKVIVEEPLTSDIEQEKQQSVCLSEMRGKQQSLCLTEQLKQLNRLSQSSKELIIKQQNENAIEPVISQDQIKSSTIRKNFERKQTFQFPLLTQTRQNALSRLNSQRTDSYDKFQQSSVNNNNKSISSQQNTLNQKEESMQSIKEYIITINKEENNQQKSQQEINKNVEQKVEKNVKYEQTELYNFDESENHQKYPIKNINNEIIQVSKSLSQELQDIEKSSSQHKLYDIENIEKQSQEDTINQFNINEDQNNYKIAKISEKSSYQKESDKKLNFGTDNQNNKQGLKIESKQTLEKSMIYQYEFLKHKEEQQQQLVKEKTSQLTIPFQTHQSSQRLQRGFSIKVTSEDCSDEDENGDKVYIRGQFSELFYDFEKVKEFKSFKTQNNISSIIFSMYKHELGNQGQFQRKRRTRKDTILNLLKQTQQILRKTDT